MDTPHILRIGKPAANNRTAPLNGGERTDEENQAGHQMRRERRRNPSGLRSIEKDEPSDDLKD